MLFFVFVSDIPRFADTVAYNVVVEVGFIWLKLGDYLVQNGQILPQNFTPSIFSCLPMALCR